MNYAGKPQRLLIAGFGRLGNALVTAFKAAYPDIRITALSRSIEARSDVHALPADLMQADSLLALGQQPFDTIVFCPAPDQPSAGQYRQLYLHGLQNLLAGNALHADGRLLFISSTAVYGQDDGSDVDENSATDPTDCNGKILLTAEQHALAWPAAAPRRRCCVRLAGLYDRLPERYLRMLDAADLDPGLLSQWSNRMHIDDAAALVVRMTQLQALPEIINGADNEPALLGDVLSWLAARRGQANAALSHHLEMRTHDPAQACRGKRISNALAHSLGFRPVYPSYRNGFILS